MAGAPAGNTNSRQSNRMLTAALKRELTQNPKDVLAIARKLIKCAKEGEPWAMTLIHDRVDGKVPQPVIGGGEDDPPLRSVTRIELVNLTNDSGTDRSTA